MYVGIVSQHASILKTSCCTGTVICVVITQLVFVFKIKDCIVSTFVIYNKYMKKFNKLKKRNQIDCDYYVKYLKK